MNRYFRKIINIRKVKRFLLPFFIAFGWFMLTAFPILAILLFNRKFNFNSTSGNLLTLWTSLFGIILLVIRYKGDPYYLPFAKKRMLHRYAKGFLFGLPSLCNKLAIYFWPTRLSRPFSLFFLRHTYPRTVSSRLHFPIHV